MISRIINIDDTLKRKSIFLLGPRQSGKSTFLKEHFKNSLYIDLLNTSIQMMLGKDPEKLKHIINEFNFSNSNNHYVIIDEIQKLPILTDVVQSLIFENPKLRFILTGSSSRKLKKAGANLLGGRASIFHFEPFVYPERKNAGIENFVAIRWGRLPSILLSQNRKEDIMDYIGIYLNEEIKAEALVRNLPLFSQFLEIAAKYSSDQIVFSNIASDLGLSGTTVKEYFKILEDTFVGSLLPSFQKSTSKKAVSSFKFYLFDNGVTNALLNRFELKPETPEWGTAFEQLVYCELMSYIRFNQYENIKLHYFRTHSQHEIDFIVETSQNKLILIEAKATKKIHGKHLKSFYKFEPQKPLEIIKKIIVCEEPLPSKEKEIEILPLNVFCERLWNNSII